MSNKIHKSKVILFQSSRCSQQSSGPKGKAKTKVEICENISKWLKVEIPMAADLLLDNSTKSFEICVKK